MADDTANEDSWLYGSSNPDSTTNEEDRNNDLINMRNQELALKAEMENEAQALEAVLGASAIDNGLMDEPPEPRPATTDDYDDPAEEMEEDEITTAATAADTTAFAPENDDDEAKKSATQDVENDGTGDEGEQELRPAKELKTSGSDEEVDEDDSDDDINVVIGDIKAAPSTYNIKQRAGQGGVGAAQDKGKGTTGQGGGKFTVEDFEGVGTVNGMPSHEFSIDSLEDKPWRKPGADITDYFNYGFNEETWRAYCERQKRIRVFESGSGLASLTQNVNQGGDRHHDGMSGMGSQPGGVLGCGIAPGPGIYKPPVGLIGEHQPSMLSSGVGSGGGIMTIGGHPPRMGMGMGPRGPRPMGSKENAIQVMTAEYREYSRTGVQMPPNFSVPPPTDEPFFPEPDNFDYGYEPTQESQWNNDNPGWVPTGIKELTPGPGMVPPPQMTGPPGVPPGQMSIPPPQMGGPPPPLRPPHPAMSGMPPPNLGMPPPPGMAMMMAPGVPPQMRMPPMGPPRMMGPHTGPPPPGIMDRERHDRDRDRERSERDRERSERDRERDPGDRERERERGDRDRSDRDRERSDYERSRDRDRDRERERERTERAERERDRDRGGEYERSDRRERDREKTDKGEDTERTDEDRERRRREREREREKERERERSRRSERSRSRDKPRRRSKSRDKERERSSRTATSSASSSSSSRTDKKKRKEDDD